jgi:hypothetical protein
VTPRPRTPTDLTLAPVVVQIDLNLQRMRDKSAADVEAELELEFDQPANSADRAERVELVLRQALRDVDLHGWRASISDDGSRVQLEGGSVTLDLGLSVGITRYIDEGVPDRRP